MTHKELNKIIKEITRRWNGKVIPLQKREWDVPSELVTEMIMTEGFISGMEHAAKIAMDIYESTAATKIYYEVRQTREKK